MWRRLKYLGDGKCRTPIVLEDIETDASFVVNVAVIALGLELDLWWFERIVLRELNLQEEYTAFIGTVRWSHDCCLKVKESIGISSRTKRQDERL